MSKEYELVATAIPAKRKIFCKPCLGDIPKGIKHYELRRRYIKDKSFEYALMDPIRFCKTCASFSIEQMALMSVLSR